MRRWIQSILPLPDAMRAGREAVDQLYQRLLEDMLGVLNAMPAEIAGKVDARAHYDDWTGGLPAAIGRRLTPEVPRMNGLPMTPFIETTLTQFLAELQARGLRERPAA